MTRLIVIAGDFQLSDSPSNRKIGDKYASLFEGAPCNTMNFPKIRDAKMVGAIGFEPMTSTV